MEASIIDEGNMKPEVMKETKEAMFASHAGGSNDEDNSKSNADKESADLPLVIDDADKTKLDSGLSSLTISPEDSPDVDEFPISQNSQKKPTTTKQDVPIPARVTLGPRQDKEVGVTEIEEKAEMSSDPQQVTQFEEMYREALHQTEKATERLRKMHDQFIIMQNQPQAQKRIGMNKEKILEQLAELKENFRQIQEIIRDA